MQFQISPILQIDTVFKCWVYPCSARSVLTIKTAQYDVLTGQRLTLAHIIRHGTLSHDMTHFNPSHAEMTCPVIANSVDPDQLASWCGLSLNIWISIKNPDQVIWLAGNWKWAWHFNLFSMTRVNSISTKYMQQNNSMNWDRISWPNSVDLDQTAS